MKKLFEKFAFYIAKRNNFKMSKSIFYIFGCHLAIDFTMRTIEILIFGEAFSHWFDIVVMIFIGVLAFYTLFLCNYYTKKEIEARKKIITLEDYKSTKYK